MTSKHANFGHKCFNMVQKKRREGTCRLSEDLKPDRLLARLTASSGACTRTAGRPRLRRSIKFFARGLLEKAVKAYLKGFEADWRDAYPGINTVTLMKLKDPPDPRREALIPVVSYAVERRIAARKSDYWNNATR